MSELSTLATLDPVLSKYAGSYDCPIVMRNSSMVFPVALLFTMFLFCMEHYSMCSLFGDFFSSVYSSTTSVSVNDEF